jgi:hypothetical protein
VTRPRSGPSTKSEAEFTSAERKTRPRSGPSTKSKAEFTSAERKTRPRSGPSTKSEAEFTSAERKTRPRSGPSTKSEAEFTSAERKTWFSRAALPAARSRGLIVRRVDDETLVYDPERHRAHCLGPLAAAIWRACDGRATASEIAARIEGDRPLDPAVVSLIARRLARAHLLDGRVAAPPDLARREWLRKAAGLGGFAILSITAPLAVEAATCVANCTGRPNGTCTTLPCCPPATGNCCNQGGGGNCTCRTGGGCSN